MLITIITLSYNSVSTIKETIDSVLMQDYEEIQYIIADDGSKDFNCDEIKKYINNHCSSNLKELIVIHNDINVGTVRNLNAALKLSKGEIIFNLSADDSFYDKSVISDWVAEFKLSGAEIITAKRSVYTESKDNVIAIEPDADKIRIIKTSYPMQLLEYIAPVNIIFGCCTARTRANILKYGGYDERYRYIEDYSSNLRLLRNGEKIHFFDRVVVNYRFAGVSSPSKINRYYLRENRNIFKNEALPYILKKHVAKKRYHKWIKGLKAGCRLKWLTEHNGSDTNFIQRAYAYFVYYVLWYPVEGIKRLVLKPASLLKIFRGNSDESR